VDAARRKPAVTVGAEDTRYDGRGATRTDPAAGVTRRREDGEPGGRDGALDGNEVIGATLLREGNSVWLLSSEPPREPAAFPSDQ
jgi:hypothetical protein